MFEPNDHLFTPVDEERPGAWCACGNWASVTGRSRSSTTSPASWRRTTKAPLAMVNFVGEERQYFAGLYAPAMIPAVPARRPRPTTRRG